MKIFSLISLAAILSHLTPAIAVPAYKCHEKVLDPIFIQGAIDKAFADQRMPVVAGPPDKLYVMASAKLLLRYKTKDIKVKFEIGANSQKGVIYITAFAGDQTFKCKETTEAPAKIQY
ncbi:putative candidate secreted effector protein [Blumeria hordei DH14]|uniref:Putative candidate secreted effector protein n=1 Tax=Blumeria graminis f. sp. hordei (strain DH14) TaxID=546991 RepID=N1JK07_BLUG1|nr:putative candidate secreted effector protein [Blumeria hordei DH14]